MIAGLVIFIIFILVERTVSQDPLIPFGARRTEFLCTLACIGTAWSSFGIFVFYTLNLLEVLRDQTPLLTSAQLTPAAGVHHQPDLESFPHFDGDAYLHDLLSGRRHHLRHSTSTPDLRGPDFRGRRRPPLG